MGQSFYYGTDSELSTSGRQFAAHLVSDPAAYGVTEAQALEMQAIAQAYAEAYAVATAPQTRTSVAVEAKRARKRLLTSAARRLGNLIIANQAVSDTQLIELGLKPRVGRSRIETPTEMPALQIGSTVGHRVELGIRQLGTGTRGKPTGVAGAAIWIHIGDDAPPAGSDAWTWYANTSRTNTTIDLPHTATPGSKVWIAAAWYNNRQQRGPWSHAAQTYVQFGNGVRVANQLRAA